MVIASTMSAQSNPPTQNLSDADIARARISSLNSRIETLEASAAFWKKFVLWGAFVAVAVGVASGIAQKFAADKEEAASRTQKELATERDRLHEIELKERDVRIAATDERAGIAKKAAGDANERAAVAIATAERERLAECNWKRMSHGDVCLRKNRAKSVRLCSDFQANLLTVHSSLATWRRFLLPPT